MARGVLLLVLALVISACGTTFDERIETQARVSFTVQSDDTAAWTPLDGTVVHGHVRVGLDINGDAGPVRVDVAGTRLELLAGAYELDLDATALEPGSYDAVAWTYIAGGRKIKEAARATFEVKAPHEPAGDETTVPDDTDDGTIDDGTTDGAGSGDDAADDDAAADGSTGEGSTSTDEESTNEGSTDDGATQDDADSEPTTQEPEAFDAPIVITEGGTYSGRWESLDSSVPAVTVDTSEPVVIQDSTIRGAGHLISAPWSDADLTVRNVAGEALYPTEAGRTPGRFLHAEGYAGILVENSAMTGTAGIYLNTSHPGATVRIIANRADDIDGRKADGAGGWDGAKYVQFVQLNAGHGLVDSVIAWNLIENRPKQSRVEDVINLFGTTGTAGSPIEVRDNFIRGAYPVDPATSSFSGGGIMLGDAGGAYQHAFRNTVVSTSNYGVAISGGHDNRIDDNTIVSCGVLSDGTQIASQNVGTYVWNMRDDPSFGANGGSGNVVAWAHPDHGRNDWWTPDADEWTDNTHLLGGDDVSCTVENDAYAAWLGNAEAMEANVGLFD